MNRLALLFFLTLGMAHFGWSIEDVKVVDTHSGLVTMESTEGVYQIEQHEAWEVGDEGKAIVRDGKMVEVRYERSK